MILSDIAGLSVDGLCVWDSWSTNTLLFWKREFSENRVFIDWRDSSDAIAISTDRDVFVVYFNSSCTSVVRSQQITVNGISWLVFIVFKIMFQPFF